MEDSSVIFLPLSSQVKIQEFLVRREFLVAISSVLTIIQTKSYFLFFFLYFSSLIQFSFAMIIFFFKLLTRSRFLNMIATEPSGVDLDRIEDGGIQIY